MFLKDELNRILYKDDYKRLSSISSKKRINPEHYWTDKLFLFGLVVEAFAIIYNVAYINVSGSEKNPEFFYQRITPLKLSLYFFALLSLLTHQMFIRNSLKEVNKITTDHWKQNPQPSFFPNNLMFSRTEYRLRSVYFIVLAVIAGEIPYLLMVLEKIITGFTHTDEMANPHHYIIYSFSTSLFIGACFFLCCVVLLWDILLISAFRRLKTNETIEYDKTKLNIFLWSDSISTGVWLIILLFVLTKKDTLIEEWLLAFSLVYILTVLYRIIILKTNPFSDEY